MKAFNKKSVNYYVDTINNGDYVFFNDGTYKIVKSHKKGTHILSFEDGSSSDLYIIYDSIKTIFSMFDEKDNYTVEYLLLLTLNVLHYLTLTCKYHLYPEVIASFIRGDETNYISEYKGNCSWFGEIPSISTDLIEQMLKALTIIGGAKAKVNKHGRVYYIARRDGKFWKTEWVWYVCYGSNLCFERFICYITGKENKKYGIKKGEKCVDQTPIIANKVITIPYEMYFGSNSSSWDDGGVSFIKETEDKNKYSIARAYLVTKKQYEHIWKREGMSDEWYGRQIELDDIDGIRALTFTSNLIHDYKKPCDRYISVIKDGLKECNISYRKMMWYINSKIL